jgi:hypothetical protein
LYWGWFQRTVLTLTLFLLIMRLGKSRFFVLDIPYLC